MNIHIESFEENLTYDDVLLVPQYSEVLPKDTDLSTYLTKDIKLKCPLISAAMDTVTEHKTAIVMAQLGGLGIIHKNMSIDEQAAEVQKVKRSESGMISDPIVVNPQMSIAQVLEIMHTYNISGFPVVENGELVGIITGRDIKFEENLNRPVSDIMTKSVITAPKGTSMQEAVRILHKHRIEKLPVVDGKKLVGLFTIKDIENSKRFPDASKDEDGKLLVGAAVGVGEDLESRSSALYEAGADILVIDTAHAHSKNVLEALKKLKNKFKHKKLAIIVGNVATPEGVKSLIDAGADAIKVGIGPGSICTTRIVTGIGVPQFSAVLKCAHFAKTYSQNCVPIIADGGIKYSGDIVKALAAGAHVVMIGNLFAGTDQAPGELVIYQGKTYKSYRGMGSLGAMQKGSKDRYFQSHVSESSKFVPEGIEGLVPYRGSLNDVVFQLTGGIRSAMGYIGVRTIAELQQKAKFIKITHLAFKESHVHNVHITKEAPNYKLDS